MKFRQQCCGRRTNLPHAAKCTAQATAKLIKDAQAFVAQNAKVSR